MKKLLLLLLGGLFLPAVAYGQDEQGTWTKGGQPGQTTSTVSRGGGVLYGTTGNDDASPILSVGNCNSIDFIHYPLWDGPGTASTTAWEIQYCPHSSLFAAGASGDAARNLACYDSGLDLDATTGNIAHGNKIAPSIGGVRVVGSASGTNTDEARIEVKCAER